MSDFSDLLFEAEKLTQEIDDPSELPKVDRSLKQVLEASNELYNRVGQSGAKDIQANLLLGSKGIDLPRIAQKLEAISSQRTFESIEPADDFDIAACLENETRNCILGILDEEHKKCFETIAEQAWEHQLGEWKQEKRKILNAMIGPSGNFIALPEHRSVFVEPIVSSSLMGQEESSYATKVMQYNLSLSHGTSKPNPVELFAKAAEDFKDTKVNDMWEIIRYMVDIPPFPKEGDPIAVRNTDAVIMILANQGKKYLENRYKTYMGNIINDNLLRAHRGGIPGTYPLVKSFVGLRFQGPYVGLLDGHIEDRPFWPMVYFCLRCGDLQATLHCLKKASVDCKDLISLIELKLAKGSPGDFEKFENNVRFQYRRFVRNATDPFKRIVWAVLGCCEVADEHGEVARTADDYLWLKLSLVRVGRDDRDDRVDYRDLQRTVVDDYGEAHYDAANQPHLYFQVLVLTGQFEAAVEFLARAERYAVHAVHMAIALNEICLLAGPSDFCSPLIFVDPADPRPSRRLNIVRLIMIYVRKFEVTSVEEAVHYFYLLNRTANEDRKNMYMVAVADLAQETREYERLFGRIRADGVRSRGLLDQFRDNEITPEIIAGYVAGKLVDKGLFEDAIDMFDVANNQVQVLNLLCTLLAQVVHAPAQEGSLRSRIQSKAKDVFARYSSDGFNCPASVVASFAALKDLLKFFDCYHSKQYTLALNVLDELKIVPLRNCDLDERVDSFKRLNIDVCKVIPDVLLATMNILYDQYQKLKSNEFLPQRKIDANLDKQLTYIREQAKTITKFTGMLPYRMPGDTNSRLVQMEILMH